MKNFLTLCTVALLAMPALAQTRTVPKGETLTVPVTLTADPLYITWTKGNVTATGTGKGSLRTLEIAVKGEAEGDDTVVVVTADYALMFDVKIVAAAPQPTTVPVPGKPGKKLDEPAPVTIPPAAPPAKKVKATIEPISFRVPTIADPSESCVNVIRRDGAGSGTVVHSADGKSLVLTCRHVCPDAAKVWVVAKIDGKPTRFEAKCIGVSHGADLAMLSVDAALTPVSLAESDPAVGDAVSHHGKASGPQSGKVMEKRFPNDIQSALLTVSGDSGAGLFDARCHLCGVIHGSEIRRDEAENGLACQSAAVREFVGYYLPKTMPAKQTGPVVKAAPVECTTGS